jgi:microcystin-dependent protein
MAQVTGMTAEKIEELTDAAIVSATVDQVSGVLTLTTRGGDIITAGKTGSSTEAVDKAYPVGSIFMSTLATNPATQLGVGTWAAWGTGRVPVGVDTSQTEFNTVNKTGGEKTHLLSMNEMPQHSHDGAPHTHSINHDHQQTNTRSVNWSESTTTGGNGTRVTDIANATGGAGTQASITFTIAPYSGNSGAAVFTGKTSLSGGNLDTSTSPHNNLQPYITCYMWKRTG